MSVKLKPISADVIIERIQFENPWWKTGRVDGMYQEMARRLYFNNFYPLVSEINPRRAVVLMGPRRVGKTVLMYHCIDCLLIVNQIPPGKICFINIENPIYFRLGLEQLFSLARKAAAGESPDGFFVFFDEIQYLPDWEIHLKVLVDSYPNTKFIVSGSAAAALKLKSGESGAGRFTDFLLPPLTFHEYIHLKDYNHLISSTPSTNSLYPTLYSTDHINELNDLFLDYINFGGYPEVIFSKQIQSDLGRYLKSDIIDKVLLRDLPSLYGIQNVQELNTFFTMLTYYCGNEVSLDGLSTSSGINKPTLKKYIDYLEAAFLIKSIDRVDDCAKKFKRQNFYKIYLTNPSLRSALFSPLRENDDALPHMVETAIFAQWMHNINFKVWYARWNGGEVDIVGLRSDNLKPSWAVEIKWSNTAYHDPWKELKSLFQFCKKNNINNAIVTTLDISDVRVVNDIKIQYLPSSVYTYNVGRNVVENKKPVN